MKKILFITNFLTNKTEGGVIRILKFCKYLPQFDWLPIIITKNTELTMLTDELDKKIKIYKTKTIEKLGIEKKLKSKPIKLKIWRKIKKLIYSYFLIPDEYIGWIPFCYKKCKEILAKEKINACYTTGPPFSTHIIGYILKRTKNLPWIADFRDLWFNNIVFEPQNRFKKFICKIIEKEFVIWADKIICATQPITDYFINYYNNAKNKFITITNGYDAEEFKNISTTYKNKFTIAYTGTLSSEYQTPKYFLAALKNLINEKPEIKNNIEVIFAGHMLDKYIKLLEEEPLSSVAKFIGYINRKEVINLICNADALLLIIYDERGGETVLTTKIFDYIGAKKPIIGLVPDGIAKELITKEKIGKVAPPKDIEKIKELIYEFYSDWKNKRLKNCKVEKLKNYERKNLTKKLSHLLNIIAK